ncbi:30S ribosomal protein S6 [Desulfolithobacter sp.]
MRHYETTYILRPNLGEDQFTEIIERTNAIITDDGGTIIDLDRWGMKRLAYEIRKEVQGYYVYINYAAPATAVEEMERIFRIDDRVLRYLTIKLADSIDAEEIARERELIAAKAEPEESTEEVGPAAETSPAEEKTE